MPIWQWNMSRSLRPPVLLQCTVAWRAQSSPVHREQHKTATSQTLAKEVFSLKQASAPMKSSNSAARLVARRAKLSRAAKRNARLILPIGCPLAQRAETRSKSARRRVHEVYSPTRDTFSAACRLGSICSAALRGLDFGHCTLAPQAPDWRGGQATKHARMALSHSFAATSARKWRQKLKPSSEYNPVGDRVSSLFKRPELQACS